MSVPKKNRTIRCSDEEWNALKKLADDEKASVAKFVLDHTIYSKSTDISETVEEILTHVKAARNGTRLLAAIAEKECIEKGEEDAFVRIKEWAQQYPERE
jgi:hypothetical protein